MKIEGTVAPGFEAVKSRYEHNMRTLTERNTQLCVYVDGERVVDLWASAVDDADFSADSLVNVFSSGKSLEAITLAMLVDRGLLNYDAKIAEYWPEYASNGKQDTTVADLMRHEAGIAAFDTTLEPGDLHPHRIQQNAVGAVVERQPFKRRPGVGREREYHALTRGWIANELFRRVEPARRTMGQFLREEISSPLGIDVFIGLAEDELSRISEVELLGFGYQFAQGLVPRAFGRRIELNLAQTVAKLWRLRGAINGGTTRGAPTPIAGMKKLSVFDSPAVSRGEVPSAGAKCSARGLAKLAAIMASGGNGFGHRLMSAETHAGLHGLPVARDMLALGTTFTQGGLAMFSPPQADDRPLDIGLNRGREGYYGWMGLGGSIFQWHPQLKIGFAYVPTSLNALDIANERGKVYQAEVVAALR